MTEWDNDRQRRFWEACGIKRGRKVEVAGVSEDVYNWNYPDGWTRLNPPDIHSLNDLFKYAVPKLMEQGYTIMCESVKEGISVLYEWCFTRGENEGIWQALDKDPALALAEAIEKVIVK